MRLGPAAMRNTPRRSAGQLRIPMLAGWLFADLFLVLFMVALSAQPSVSQAAHVKKSHTLPVKPKSTQPVLQRTPADFWIYVDPAGLSDQATRARTTSSLLQAFNSELASLRLQGHRAGFVLAFATAPMEAVNSALQEANSAISIIEKHDAATFGRASGEGLWGGQGSAQAGHSGQPGFHFQIFFFA